jgi:hypothetical protein
MALPHELLGAWMSDPTDLEGVEEFGNVSLEFTADGSLTYTIHADQLHPIDAPASRHHGFAA